TYVASAGAVATGAVVVSVGALAILVGIGIVVGIAYAPTPYTPDQLEDMRPPTPAVRDRITPTNPPDDEDDPTPTTMPTLDPVSTPGNTCTPPPTDSPERVLCGQRRISPRFRDVRSLAGKTIYP